MKNETLILLFNFFIVLIGNISSAITTTVKDDNTALHTCDDLPPKTLTTAVNTFTVTNNNPNGPGSLHQAIIDSNNASGADIITFSAAFTINITGTSLSDAFPEINDDLY